MTQKTLSMLKENSPLGKVIPATDKYAPELLYAIARENKRLELGILNAKQLPFHGADLWNAYELSWLNSKGKPEVAIGSIMVPVESEFIFESKSLKLYLTSFSGTSFESIACVEQQIQKDLSKLTMAPVSVKLELLDTLENTQIVQFPGTTIDNEAVEISRYEPYPSYLTTKDTQVEEKLYSNLLKSNCLVTNQPDWGSVYIEYAGPKICHKGLLKYIISLRNHNEFHEQCVERIFMNILKYCKPQSLTVYARYNRRGGIDINPYRTTLKNYKIDNHRLARQ